jgi:hypothetical protein
VHQTHAVIFIKMVHAFFCDKLLQFYLFSHPPQNKVGLTEALVDDSGYPRQDLDVYQVRHARHRIICKLQHLVCS